MKKIFIIILLCLVNLAHAKLSATVDKTTISAQESFNLILTGDHMTGIPDLRPLEESFKILATQRRVNYSLINNVVNSSLQWRILLRPKKTGILNIPAINFGSQKTKPLKIAVRKAATIKKIARSEIFFNNSLEKNDPYLNEQVIYNVNIYYQGSILNSSYEPPVINNALLIALGKSQQSQVIFNNKLYNVISIRYAIYPQKSGSLIITPPKFLVILTTSYPKKLLISTKNITLQVKKIPQSFAGIPWFIAKDVNLSQEFSYDGDKLRPGSIITRTITVQTEGTIGELIPEIKSVNGYKLKSSRNYQTNHKKVIGSLKTKFSYQVKNTKNFTVPAVKITWFDSLNNIKKTVSLKALHYPVWPPKIFNKRVKQQTQRMSFVITATFIFIILVIICIIIPRNNLKKVCIEADLHHVRLELITWAKKKYPAKRINNIKDIAKATTNEALSAELLALEEILYKPNSNKPWQGAKLWRIIKNDSSSSKKSTLNKLPKLYK